MGKYAEELREWAESFTNHIFKMAQGYENASTYAGLCNSVLLGLMKGKNKRTFYVSNELIEQFQKDKKGLVVTCHGTDKRGRIKYVAEVKTEEISET